MIKEVEKNIKNNVKNSNESKNPASQPLKDRQVENRSINESFKIKNEKFGINPNDKPNSNN